MIPKLNDTPKYELNIPSMNKQVKFRPYLVKEEKVLMMAFESKDQKAALDAVAETITSCVNDEIQIKDLEALLQEFKSNISDKPPDLRNSRLFEYWANI